MDKEQDPNTVSRTQSWSGKPVLIMCVVSLAVGLVAGYLLRASAPVPVQGPVAQASAPAMQAVSAPAAAPAPSMPPQKMPSLDDMKRMADTKAAPLLAKLKSDENNPQLQNQIGLIYEKAHQFKEAAGYFKNSLERDPKNIGTRADYASCLYYTGDIDGALAQLNESLKYDPKHVGTLFNIGIIRWKGKNDIDGAVASWEKLLQYHPDFPQKEMLQHMIQQAKQAKTMAAGKGDKG
jgi:cytochrome c-type biogenesis protein CcmH/NrfG